MVIASAPTVAQGMSTQDQVGGAGWGESGAEWGCSSGFTHSFSSRYSLFLPDRLYSLPIESCSHTSSVLHGAHLALGGIVFSASYHKTLDSGSLSSPENCFMLWHRKVSADRDKLCFHIFVCKINDLQLQ